MSPGLGRGWWQIQEAWLAARSRVWAGVRFPGRGLGKICISFPHSKFWRIRPRVPVILTPAYSAGISMGSFVIVRQASDSQMTDVLSSK